MLADDLDLDLGPHPVYIGKTLRYFSTSQRDLTLNGVGMASLAALRQRPIYVMNEKEMRCHMRSYLDTLARCYPGTSDVFYASKAFLNTSMAVLVHQEGMGLDVCSVGELFVAQHAGVPAERIIMHGNNKSEQDLKTAVKAGIRRIVVDNEDEFALLEKVCRDTGKSVDILLRINPCVIVDADKRIATSDKDAKFGLDIDDVSLINLFLLAFHHKQVRLRGIHFHVGSSLKDTASHQRAFGAVLSLIQRLAQEGVTIAELDIGGGLGIEYDCGKPALSIADFTEALCAMVVKGFERMPLPHLMLEPGRSVVGRENCVLYTIGAIKEKGGMLYAAVNGGMSDNMRPYLYQARYTAMLANKMGRPVHRVPYKIVGNCCESGDILIDKVFLPYCEPGDTLALLSAGAYGFSLANTYNKFTLPGVVFVRDNAYDWTTSEQDVSDLVRYDCIPPHLRRTP